MLLQYGKCSDSTYDNIIINLPLSYSNIRYTLMSSTYNLPNVVCNRCEIRNESQVRFTRSGSYNVTGWYLTIGF